MINIYTTEVLVNSLIHLFIYNYLLNFCKYVFSTAGTSHTDFDIFVDPDTYSPAIEKLEADMMSNATNSVKLAEIIREKEKKEAELEEKMDRWVYLNDLAEQIEAEKASKG